MKAWFKHWRLLLSLSVLGLVLWAAGLAGYVAWANRRGVVSKANFRRVHVGLTETEVNILFGISGALSEVRDASPGVYARSWRHASGVEFIVYFDQGMVTNAAELPPPTSSLGQTFINVFGT